MLNCNLLTVNAELERNLDRRDSDLVHSRNALVLALAKLVERRDTETGSHLLRLQNTAACLAEKAALMPLFANQIDGPFIEMLECCAPLHDNRQSRLARSHFAEARQVKRRGADLDAAHTTIARDAEGCVKQHGSALVFLQMRSTSRGTTTERFDGTGYPDRLLGKRHPVGGARRGDLRRVRCPALAAGVQTRIVACGDGAVDDRGLAGAFRSGAAADLCAGRVRF